jgi:hypothetical protein
MNKALLSGLVAGTMVIGACGAAKWQEPYNWTLRSDGRLRASQRKEDFNFAEWSAKYLKVTGAKEYGIVITPAGAAEIAAELSRRNAKIIELENKLSQCR